jgi:hypothetical protein
MFDLKPPRHISTLPNATGPADPTCRLMSGLLRKRPDRYAAARIYIRGPRLLWKNLTHVIYPLQSATTSALSENDVAGSPDKAAYSFGLGDALTGPGLSSRRPEGATEFPSVQAGEMPQPSHAHTHADALARCKVSRITA